MQDFQGSSSLSVGLVNYLWFLLTAPCSCLVCLAEPKLLNQADWQAASPSALPLSSDCLFEAESPSSFLGRPWAVKMFGPGLLPGQGSFVVLLSYQDFRISMRLIKVVYLYYGDEKSRMGWKRIFCFCCVCCHIFGFRKGRISERTMTHPPSCVLFRARLCSGSYVSSSPSSPSDM